MDFKELKKDARFKVESLMGIFDFAEEKFSEIQQKLNSEKLTVEFLEQVLVIVRQQLRKQSEYKFADTIKNALEGVGITFEDSKNDTKVLKNCQTMFDANETIESLTQNFKE